MMPDRKQLLQSTITAGFATIGIAAGALTLGATAGAAATVGLAASAFLGNVASDWTASQLLSFYDRWTANWFTQNGALHPDLYRALVLSFQHSVRQIELDWQSQPHYKHLARTDKKAAKLTLAPLNWLREDGDLLIDQPDHLLTSLQTDDAVSLMNGATNAAKEQLDGALAGYLFGHDPELIAFVQTRFMDEWELRFYDILFASDDVGTRAWRTFQRLQEQTLAAFVVAIGQDTAAILQVVKRLEDWSKRLAELPVSVHEPTGQEALKQARAQVTDRLDQLQSTVDSTAADIQEILNLVRPRSYIPPFQAPLPPVYLVPRPEIADPLKSLLLSEPAAASEGVVIGAIQGLPGIGKTTIAQVLSHDPDILARFSDGVLWITLGRQPELLPLLSKWIQALDDYQGYVTGVDQATDVLRTLLHDKATLLVVDDVWNVDDARPFLVAGSRSRVVITTRRARIAEELDAHLYRVKPMKVEQSLELLRRHIGRELRAEELNEARALARAVGYLPLALRLSAVRVHKGISWTTLQAALEAEIARLEELEHPARRRRGDLQLTASFNLSINALKDADEEAWRCFAWLGVLPEDAVIVAPMAATLWGVEVADSIGLLEILEDEALLERDQPLLLGGTQWISYRIHDLIHDMTRRHLTSPMPQGLETSLADAHNQLLERYRAQISQGFWHKVAVDGYIHARLTWHMAQAGQIDLVHSLLAEETDDGQNGWYQVLDHLGETAVFMDDVAYAWQHADTAGVLPLQWRYALIVSSINSLAINLPPELIEQLVHAGIWSGSQALAYVRQIPDRKVRSDALAALRPHLAEEEQRTVWAEEIAFRVLSLLEQDRERGWTLAAPENLNKRVRSRWLVSLARDLSEEERPAVLAEAFATVLAIGNGEERFSALNNLALAFSESEQPTMLGEAVAAAGVIDDGGYRSQALAVLAPYLPEEDRPAVLAEALAAAHTIGDEWSRSNALVVLTWFLPEEDRPAVQAEAVVAARAIDDERYRSEALAALALNLSEEERPAVLAEALAAARAIGDGWYRARALITLLPDLLEQQRATVLFEALAAARAIGGEGERCKALIALAPHLADKERSLVLAEALAAARAIENEVNRCEALVALVSHLPEGLLTEALATARTIGDDWYRSEALVALAPRLPESLLAEALSATCAIQNVWAHSKALTALAPYLPKHLIAEALATARADKNKWVRSQTLAILAPRLAKDEQLAVLGEALAAACVIGDEWARSNALVALAPHLPERLLTEMLAAAANLGDEWYRSMTLAALLPHLAEEERPTMLADALEAVRAIQSEEDWFKALAVLAPHLPMEDRRAMLAEALAAARAIGDEKTYSEALDLLYHLPEEERLALLNEALAVARSDEFEWSRSRALTALAPHLPEEERAVVLGEALASALACTDWHAWDVIWILTSLAPHLPEEERRMVLAVALTADISADLFTVLESIKALVALAPYLPEQERTAVLAEALATARAADDEWDRSRSLTALAPHLPEGERLAVLTEALVTARGIGAISDTKSIARPDALNALAPQLAQISPTSLAMLLTETLHILARYGRGDLLGNVRSLLPAFEALAAPEDFAAIAHAIVDVTRWWP